MVGASVTRLPAGSCAEATVAEFVTLGSAAGPTPTTSAKVMEPPGGTGPGCVAVTTPAASVKLQLSPLAETYVRPLGRLSVTVMVPVAGPVPRFRTTMV